MKDARRLEVGAAVHLGLAVVALALMPFDDRLVTGVSPWLKPFKFMMSIAIYLATLAFLVRPLAGARKTVAWVSHGATWAMLGETACLWIQAARATTSHYNIATAFDGALFGVMGVLIALNSLLLVALLVAYFRTRTDLSPVVTWGIRLGLIGILAGSLQGGAMIENRAHTVGAPDGGPGLPVVNWSTKAGDLRIAHALGLHALQVLPLLGVWLDRRRWTARGKVIAVFAGAALYLSLVALTYVQAVGGQPLWTSP